MEVTLIHLRLVLFVTIVATVLLSCAAQKTPEDIRIDALVDEIMNSGKQVYLAHNLWYEDPEIVEAINFKDLKFKLVAGTAVENLAPMFSNDNMFIRFNVCGEKQILRLCSNFRYQMNDLGELTYNELLTRTFTTKSFDELTAGLKSAEIDNILQGTIQRGMSKQALLISWGYPPRHYTKSLSDPQWTYWKKRVQREYVDFDENDRVLNSTWYGNGGNAVDVIE